MLLAADWGIGEAFLSILWFGLFFLWIMLVIQIFTDIFRSRDLSGWGKAGWALFIIILPYLGVLVYLIARGSKMSEHQMQDAAAGEEAVRTYIRGVAGTSGSPTEELARLHELRQNGVIDDAEYSTLKAKIIQG